jgi:hypothetical protein
LLGSALAGHFALALAETPVEGPITVDTTWDVAGAPYHVIDTVTVQNAATLTILPGVEVRLDQTKSIFFDLGSTLDAQGTADSTIVFTRSGSFGHWGVIAGYSAVMTFRHCLIEYGGTDTFNTLYYSGMIGSVGGTTVVEDCTLQETRLDAAAFAACTLEFRRNLIQDTGSMALRSLDRVVATIEDNRIERTGDDAFDVDRVREGEFVFRNNVAIDVGDDALDIDSADEGTVRIGNFEAYGVADKGVSVSMNSVSVIVENMIIVNADEAYTVTNRSALSVFNCVAHGCGRGFSAYQKDPPWDGGKIYVYNSITWDTVEPVFVDGHPASEANVIFSILDTVEPYPGVGNLNVNPNFLRPLENDFRLRFDSPAIDAGFSDGMPEFDIRGNPRVDHPGVPDTGAGPFTYYDIGAHEFDPNVTAVFPDGLGVPARGGFGLRASPSPAFGNVTIDFELTRGREVDVGIYDPAGRLVERLHSGQLAAGRHTVNWNASVLRAGSGLYFIRLRAGSEAEIERLVRVR